MPLGYISPEQLMKDKAEYARKGIARGRSAVVLQYDNGILFVAENRSRTLHKISEIYDRIAFAAVGLYYEFENLRQAGIRLADIRGYTNARSDVTARGLANAYAQTLGSIFTDAHKPYEVELVVAEVGATSAEDQIYRLTFDGSVQDEQGYLVMGGITERVSSALAERYERGQSLEVVLREAVTALERQEEGNRELAAAQLEVGVLDRTRNGRKFRRLQGGALERLLAATATAPDGAEAPAAEEPETEAEAETEVDGGAERTAESDAEADGGAEPEAGTDGADTEATDGGGPAGDSDDDGAGDEGPSRA